MFVVTGGGSGIGKALAHALSLREQSVLIIGRRESMLVGAAAYSPLISYLCADVSTEEGRQRIFSHLSQINHIDAFIHNAGVIEPLQPLLQVDEVSWQKIMSTNVNAPLFLTQLLQKKLQGSRVLFVGSGVAHFPVVGWGAYCVSKAALSMLTRCLQLESSAIACANVMPGIIDTAMQEQIRSATCMDPERLEFFKQLYRQDHLISAETVAMFLCWLLLELDKQQFVSKEWDIYDQSHHSAWLIPPHVVPPLE